MMEITHDYKKLLRGAKALMSAILLDVARDYLDYLQRLYKSLPSTQWKHTPAELIAKFEGATGNIGFYRRMALDMREYLEDHACFYGMALIRKADEKIMLWVTTGKEPYIGRKPHSDKGKPRKRIRTGEKK